MSIRNEHVKVTAHFHEQGSVLRGDAEGFADRFEVEMYVDTDEPVEEVSRLFTLARQMCFTEKALMGATQLDMKHVVNGKPFQA